MGEYNSDPDDNNPETEIQTVRETDIPYSHGGDKQSDISARMTIPDVDGVILETAAKLAASRENETHCANASPAQTSDDRESPDASLTIPPASGYGSLVAMTQSEEALRALKTTDAPLISVDETPLKEQLLFDPDLMPAARAVSLLEEAGLVTENYISAMDDFASESVPHISNEDICSVLMTFFGNLADSLLVVLDKRSARGDDITLARAEKMIPEYLRAEKSVDKALLLTLRLVTKLAELYRIKSADRDNPLYDKFASYLKDRSDY